MQAILEFFKKFIDSFSKDLQFAIEDISAEDSLAVGVTWHLGINIAHFVSLCTLLSNHKLF